ncbi:scavenger receptor cysteine-rich domain-containing protein DMBT1-like [Haliotis cracherodii]|uniref:scavenger receptor cysteine-rich domain-containing protein DMBT1-like n=1 Tax=Haliotis cracherodii TaxID=6455 RepID=UPI0039E91B35
MFKKSTRQSQQLAVLIPTLLLWTRILGQPATDNDCKTVVAVADLAKKAIRSAGYPSGYEPNKECTWVLSAGRMFYEKKTIKVQFIVDIENSTDCSGESVTVHPFTSPNNTKLAVLCGNTEREYEFFIESLLVVFKSGSSPSQGRKGFKMVFQMIDETSCHERLDSHNYNTRAIHSPRYPDPYPSFQRCTYLIRTRTANHNTELKVILSELSADCRDEYVLVYDGNSEQGPLLGKWCGSERPKFRSLVQELYVVFVSKDNSSGRKGFRADYRDAMCGGTASARRSFQNDIVFPGYSSPFNHYITCKWYITPTSGFTSVLVAFRNLQVDCARSRITVYDGLSDRDRTWIICGKEDYTYLISGPGMLVEFNSQGNTTEPISFKIKHRGDNNTACRLKGNDRDKAYLLTYSYEQILLSPGYPDLYPDRIRCVWQLKSDHYLDIVMINVETLNLYSQPVCGDSVRIYHGAVSDLTKTPDMVLCHTESNVFYSDGRYATIDFITDDFGIGKGFRIVYKSTPKKNVRSEGTGVSHTVSSSTPMIAAVCSVIGVIIFIVIVVTCCFVMRKRRSDRMPQPPVVQTTLHPPPQTREQATPFLQTTTTTTDNTTNTSAPPPSYQDLNYLPVTEPSAPPMLPPSYEDAVTKGMIEKDSETRF